MLLGIRSLAVAMHLEIYWVYIADSYCGIGTLLQSYLSGIDSILTGNKTAFAHTGCCDIWPG
ncbi:hypothetical protein [Photorhabdus australis]|uniref:hypothetical protein n=1 Tax=Photorhabdus australis TaxID=286156 RepID=UPI0030DD56FA